MAKRPVSVILEFLFKSDNAKRGIDNTVTQLGKLDKGLNTANKSIFNTQKLLSNLGKIGITFSLASLAKNAVRDAATFEVALDSLASITGATGNDLDFLQNKALEFSSRFNIAANGIAKAFEIIGSERPELLTNVESLAQVTEAALTLSKASKDSAENSGTALATVLNQFGLAGDESNRIINTLAAGSKFGAANINNIAASYKQFGGVIASQNGTVEQGVALIETIAPVVGKGSRAGIQLRNVLLTLQKEGFGALEDGSFNVTKALEDLEAKQFDAIKLTEIFGVQNVLTAQVLSKNVQTYKDFEQSVTGTNTAFEQAAINSDNTIARFSKLQTTITNTGISFAQNLQPAINAVLGVFTSLVVVLGTVLNALAKNSEVVAAVIGTYFAVTRSIALYSAAQQALILIQNKNIVSTRALALSNKAYEILLGKLSTATKLYALAQALLTGNLQKARIAFASLNLVMAANPIGLVAAAIALLVGGLVLLYKNSETVRTSIGATFDVFKRVGNFVAGELVNQFSFFIESLQAAAQLGRDLFSAFSDFGEDLDFAKFGKALLNAFIKVTLPVTKFVERFVKNIKDTILGIDEDVNIRISLTEDQFEVKEINDKIDSIQKEINIAIKAGDANEVERLKKELEETKIELETELKDLTPEQRLEYLRNQQLELQAKVDAPSTFGNLDDYNEAVKELSTFDATINATIDQLSLDKQLDELRATKLALQVEIQAKLEDGFDVTDLQGQLGIIESQISVKSNQATREGLFIEMQRLQALVNGENGGLSIDINIAKQQVDRLNELKELFKEVKDVQETAPNLPEDSPKFIKNQIKALQEQAEVLSVNSKEYKSIKKRIEDLNKLLSDNTKKTKENSKAYEDNSIPFFNKALEDAKKALQNGNVDFENRQDLINKVEAAQLNLNDATDKFNKLLDGSQAKEKSQLATLKERLNLINERLKDDNLDVGVRLSLEIEKDFVDEGIKLIEDEFTNLKLEPLQVTYQTLQDSLSDVNNQIQETLNSEEYLVFLSFKTQKENLNSEIDSINTQINNLGEDADTKIVESLVKQRDGVRTQITALNTEIAKVGNNFDIKAFEQLQKDAEQLDNNLGAINLKLRNSNFESLENALTGITEGLTLSDIPDINAAFGINESTTDLENFRFELLNKLIQIKNDLAANPLSLELQAKELKDIINLSENQADIDKATEDLSKLYNDLKLIESVKIKVFQADATQQIAEVNNGLQAISSDSDLVFNYRLALSNANFDSVNEDINRLSDLVGDLPVSIALADLETEAAKLNSELNQAINNNDSETAARVTIELDNVNSDIEEINTIVTNLDNKELNIITKFEIDEETKAQLAQVREVFELTDIDASTNANDRLQQIYRDFNEGRIKNTKELEAEIKKVNEDIANTATKTRLQQLNDEIKILEQSKTENVKLSKEYQDLINERSELELAKEKETAEKTVEERKALNEALKAAAVELKDAAIQAANEVLNARIANIDALKAKQEQRIEDALNSTDDASSQQLELERKRLADLEDERRKFVNIQKGLAATEVALNIAIAIAKAAGQAGAGAPVVLPLVLSAVAAGLGLIPSLLGGIDGFYKGVIGYKGRGTDTSDSNVVKISNNESIITAATTKKSKPTLKYLESNKANYDLMNAVATGNYEYLKSYLEDVTPNKPVRDTKAPAKANLSPFKDVKTLFPTISDKVSLGAIKGTNGVSNNSDVSGMTQQQAQQIINKFNILINEQRFTQEEIKKIPSTNVSVNADAKKILDVVVKDNKKNGRIKGRTKN